MPSRKPTKAQARKIREIRSRGLSEAYEKRLIRGVLSGKSQQQARGHRRGEARERREREREENEGLAKSEETSVRNWYRRRYNPAEHDEKPTEDQVVEFARENGIDAFRTYQKLWNSVRREYLAELKAGTWESRGLGQLEAFTNDAGVPDNAWMYYH